MEEGVRLLIETAAAHESNISSPKNGNMRVISCSDQDKMPFFLITLAGQKSYAELEI